MPNFEIDRSSGHAVHFKTEFAATVKGMDGDVELKSVKVEFGKTSLVAHGEVAGKGWKGGQDGHAGGDAEDGDDPGLVVAAGEGRSSGDDGSDELSRAAAGSAWGARLYRTREFAG